MPKYRIPLVCALGMMLAGATLATAQDDPAVKAYKAAMQTMHEDMMVDYTAMPMSILRAA